MDKHSTYLLELGQKALRLHRRIYKHPAQCLLFLMCVHGVRCAPAIANKCTLKSVRWLAVASILRDRPFAHAIRQCRLRSRLRIASTWLRTSPKAGWKATISKILIVVTEARCFAPNVYAIVAAWSRRRFARFGNYQFSVASQCSAHLGSVAPRRFGQITAVKT